LDCTLTEIEEEVRPEAEGMHDSIVDQKDQEEGPLVEPQESNSSPEVMQDPGVTLIVKIPAAKISASTSALHGRRATTKATLVVSDVRRSVRLSEKS
jgi:hypothetical protein